MINAYIRKKGRSQVNHLTLRLQEVEGEQTKLKVSGRKEIVKIRAEMSEVENFFKKIEKNQRN